MVNTRELDPFKQINYFGRCQQQRHIGRVRRRWEVLPTLGSFCLKICFCLQLTERHEKETWSLQQSVCAPVHDATG